MNIRCPQCQSVFRVDPERIPASGIRARCARCSAVFALTRNGISAAPRSDAPAVSSPTDTTPVATEPAPADASQSMPPTAQSPTAQPAPAAQPAASSQPQTAESVVTSPAASSAAPQPAPVVEPVQRPAEQAPVADAPGATVASPAAPTGGTRPRPSFGRQDPHTRANRIARALVSDIVAYHRDRRDQTLAAGTLKLELRDEIRKSWEEYVEQVGLDLARTTPYFRDALNAILANGQPLF